MTKPLGWSEARLDEIADVRLGRQRSPDKAHGDNLVPYLRAANVRWTGLDLSDVKTMQFSPEEVETFRLRRNDILVVEASGSRNEVGKSALWREELPLVCLQNTLIRVRPRDGIEPEFLRWHLHLDASTGDLGGASKGIGIHHIGAARLASWLINVPPRNEQHRIIAKVDAIFEQARAAKARLERLPALLDRLKRSILAAAFRGDLTADWRAAHPEVMAAPSQEFESTRGRLWGSGADAARPTRKLPSRWRWAQLRELGPDAVQIGPMSMKSNEFTDTGTTVLNVGCVQWGRLDLSKCDHLPPSRASDFERYRVRAGDVLFTRSGSVGRSALATSDVDGALMTFHLLRVRASSNMCRSRFLYLALRGVPEVRAAIEDVAVGATRAGFNTRLLESLWIPLPPLEEQAEIEDEAESALGSVSAMEARTSTIESNLSRLESSALAKAFRGELVAQDPADEPASALLQRIRDPSNRDDGAAEKAGAGRRQRRSAKARVGPRRDQATEG